MKREEKLFEVLKALAVSSKKALTISTIIKKANYTNHKLFVEDMKKLKELGLIEIRQSGFMGHSMAHPKIICLQAEPLIVHAETEFPLEDEIGEEKATVKICSESSLNPFDLVKIPGVLSGWSYQTKEDQKRNDSEEKWKTKWGNQIEGEFDEDEEERRRK